MSLSSVPDELLLPILRKVNSTSLCRLRQTCKKIDACAENNRYRLSCKPEENELVLIMEITDNEPPTLEISIGDSPLNSDNHRYRYTKAPVMVEDPFEQLSGLEIGRIFLIRAKDQLYYDAPPRNGGYSRQPVVPSPYEPVWETALVPLLTRLRIKCERLSVRNPVSLIQLFSLIQFKELLLWEHPEPLEDLGNLSNENCEEFTIFQERHLLSRQRLSPVVRNFKKFKWEEASNSDVGYMRIKEFLMEAVMDRSAAGKLEHLTFEIDSHQVTEDLDDLPGVVKVWEEDQFDEMSIYLLEISDGYEVIVQKTQSYDIFFPPQYCRHAVFEIIVHFIFKKLPIDTSSIHDRFTTAPTVEEAFSKLNRTSSDIYECYEEESDSEEDGSSEDESEEESDEEESEEDDDESEEEADSGDQYDSDEDEESSGGWVTDHGTEDEDEDKLDEEGDFGDQHDSDEDESSGGWVTDHGTE